MKRSKNSVTLILMISSIVLMLLLQVFWLRTAYRDAEDDFRKETNFIFRNTIFSMHDSLIQRNIEPVYSFNSSDTLMKKHTKKKGSMTIRRIMTDSIVSRMDVSENGSRIEIFTTEGRSDSVQSILRPLISKLENDRGPRSFVLRLSSDSLKLDSIKFNYKIALDQAGINSPFKVSALKRKMDGHEKMVREKKGEMTSDIVPIGPMNRYAVTFTGIEGTILKEITPEILFSIFLSGITILAFYVMYRNLRSQQRLMQIKNDFISNVTHELKTPVATVSVALEALKNFNALDNPKRTSEYLEIAQNELNRLTLMTDKILKTAVFEDQGVDLKIERFDLDLLIQQVLSSMKLVFEKRRTQLNYSKEGTDFFVDGSQSHLTNVLYNLLDNALKYSGDDASVAVSLKIDKQQVILTVKDSGVGIPAEYQKRIFEKFFRVPSGDIHTIKGYGLGLSYVHSVVQSLHGTIRVESLSNAGSTFIITLPVEQAKQIANNR